MVWGRGKAKRLTGTDMGSGVRFRTYPDKRTQANLRMWLLVTEQVYNAKIAEYELARSAGVYFKADSEWRHLVGETLHAPEGIYNQAVWRWRNSFQRFQKKMSLPPSRKNIKGRRTVTVGSENFAFYSEIATRQVKVMLAGQFEVPFKAYRQYGIPHRITITFHGDKWYLSFAYGFEKQAIDQNQPQAPVTDTQSALLVKVKGEGRAETLKRSLGISGDVPMIDSEGTVYDFDPAAKRRLQLKENRLKRYKRKLKRQVDGSRRKRQTHKAIEKIGKYRSNVCRDFVNKTARKLVDHPAEVLIFASQKKKLSRDGIMPGYTRSALRVVTNTKRLAFEKKLIVVVPHSECLIQTAHSKDLAERVQRKGLDDVFDGSFQPWQQKKVWKKKKVVGVGHAEVKCVTPVGKRGGDISLLSPKRLAGLATVKQEIPLADVYYDLLVRSLKREASLVVAVHRLCDDYGITYQRPIFVEAWRDRCYLESIGAF